MSAFGERRGWRGREADTGAMTPRSAYSAKKRRAETLTMDLMMNLDAHTIASIKKEFVENGGEVDIYEFVRIMRTYLPEHLEVRKAGAGDADDAEDGKSSGDADRGGGGASRTGGGWRASTRRLNEGAAAAQSAADEAGMARQQRQRSVSEMQLVANLCELFKEIDVNGDAMMEWDEFTSFIVDKAVVFRDDASVDAIAGYHPAHLPPVVEERSKRMAVAKAVRGGTKKRAPQFHNEVIENVKFIPRLNQLAVLEQRSPVVKMYNARTMGLAGTLKGHDGIPEAVEYLETPSSYLISRCVSLCVCVVGGWLVHVGSTSAAPGRVVTGSVDGDATSVSLPLCAPDVRRATAVPTPPWRCGIWSLATSSTRTSHAGRRLTCR